MGSSGCMLLRGALGLRGKEDPSALKTGGQVVVFPAELTWLRNTMRFPDVSSYDAALASPRPEEIPTLASWL